MPRDLMTGKKAVIETLPSSPPFVQEAWDLEVYKKAYAISLVIHQEVKEFPQDERFEMASQMRRCSKSICANLAEGFAKQHFSKAEFKRFIAMSIGAAAEMQVWCQYALDLGYVSDKQSKAWKETYKTISRMLQRLHMHS